MLSQTGLMHQNSQRRMHNHCCDKEKHTEVLLTHAKMSCLSVYIELRKCGLFKGTYGEKKTSPKSMSGQIEIMPCNKQI